MAEAHYTRTDTAEGARFDVTPMPKLFAKGCLIFCGAVLGIGIMIGGIMIGASNPARPGSSAQVSSAAMEGFLYSGILWVPFLLATFFAYRSHNKHSRAPVSLLVNAEGIRVGDRSYRAADIQKLLIKHPDDRGDTSAAPVGRGSETTGGQIGGMIAGADKNRSYALMVRLKSSSRPEMLVFGLTWHVAKDLLDDVSEALSGG